MRARRAAGVAVLAMTVGVATAQGANAVDWHGCTSGSLCVWQGQNFTLAAVPGGSKFSQTNYAWRYDGNGATFAVWDNDESWVNHSSAGNSVGVYANVGYAGWVEVCLYPGTTLTGTSGRNANNGRSNKWKSGNGCYAAL